jgi:hypothetical protein
LLVEWRGPIRLPERDPLPADLRVDHAFVVSCKNLSKVLRNPSPIILFREGRTDRGSGQSGKDWYHEIAPVEYYALYSAVCTLLGLRGFPASPTEMNKEQKLTIKSALASGWPDELSREVATFVSAVSERSAASLRNAVKAKHEKEQLYWELLRLHGSSYYILGNQALGPTRLRTLTPWDFRKRYAFEGMEIEPAGAGQPQVNWRAWFTDSDSKLERLAEGHIEVRWSHGKFHGAPESKVYLDTPHTLAPGYEPI